MKGLIIKTNQPLLRNQAKITAGIADFWDQISEGWNKVWGPHIHHGYYENQQTRSPLEAQEKLIQKLADLLDIHPNHRILDVGCGMGGSSRFLAKNYQAIVSGITLSPKQVQIAQRQASLEKIANVDFKVENALALPSFADNSMDLVWSLESCEQFYDKNLFISQAYRVLKPGGQLLLATWCSDREEYQANAAAAYLKLCQAFDLPYMPTMESYRATLQSNHFVNAQAWDWSPYVEKSWDIGVSLVKGYSLFQLLRMGGLRGWRFARQIRMMQQAFHTGRVKYGVFVAQKG